MTNWRSEIEASEWEMAVKLSTTKLTDRFGSSYTIQSKDIAQ